MPLQIISYILLHKNQLSNTILVYFGYSTQDEILPRTGSVLDNSIHMDSSRGFKYW